MNLYLFLSVIIVCITIIICFIICNYTDISDYYKYKSAYYELEKLKDEYDENSIKQQTQIKNLCNNIEQLKIFNTEYVRNNNNLIGLIYDINNILICNNKNDDIVNDIKTKLNTFHF